MESDKQNELKEKVVAINRVTKVVKGGRRFSFSALVIAGNGQGRVGYGLGKSAEVPDAIRKATDQAKKNLCSVALDGVTIPFDVMARYGACKVMMRPAPAGTGVIAGGAVRALAELAGIRNIVTKCHGTSNVHNVVKAATLALKKLVSKQEILEARGWDESRINA